MKRCFGIAFMLFAVSTIVQGAPSRDVPAAAPDFWYVVPAGQKVSEFGSSRSVRGIVVPSAVHPNVRTTASGSVISWRRPDGTRQSFAVAGMSSFAFEPGPLEGTTYVPFFAGIIYRQPPNSCCICASWENAEESFDALSCVLGCPGCGCEGCICKTGPNCSRIVEANWTLVANNDPAARLTFGSSDHGGVVTFGGDREISASFQGARLSAGVGAEGETVVTDPDSIAIPGGVEARVLVEGDKEFHAWSSQRASVILEQPRVMAAPSFRDGTIELNSHAVAGAVSPVMDRCSVCGTHPNSDGDVDQMVCIPGSGTCYRCISWECYSPGN
jgi:hypothetical protein